MARVRMLAVDGVLARLRKRFSRLTDGGSTPLVATLEDRSSDARGFGKRTCRTEPAQELGRARKSFVPALEQVTR